MDTDRDSFTISEFCAGEHFSRSTYYNLPPEDRPEEMRFAGLVRITPEARAAWRRRMQKRAAAKRKAAAG